jgi:hypothetical protein
MITELVFITIGVGFTVPAVTTELAGSSFAEFTPWIRLLPQFLLVCALCVRFIHKRRVTLVLSGVSLLGTYFLLIFTAQNSSYAICASLGSFCGENEELTCTGPLLPVWESVLYLVGLLQMIMVTTVLIRNISKELKLLKIKPEPQGSEN